MFYSKAFTTTEALRYPDGLKDNGHGQKVTIENKSKDSRNIKPVKHPDPENKFPGISAFTFPGIDTYKSGDNVGITLQIEDGNGKP